MNHEQIIEYLRNRHRSQFEPPAGAVASVMSAVDDAGPGRSSISAMMPIAATVTVGLVALAIFIGVAPNLGPAPDASEPPASSAASTMVGSPVVSSPAPTGEARGEKRLLEPRDTASLPATDNDGEWGMITVERGEDLGGYPDAEVPSNTFVIELFVTYDADRMPEPAQFGTSDWVVRSSDPIGDGFFVAEARYFERANGIGLRPAMPLGEYPGAVDIFTTPTEGRIAFAIPRVASDQSLELVYRLGDQEQAFPLRNPAQPPEPVAVATPQPTSDEAIAAAAARAAALFVQPDECMNLDDGYRLNFPEAWYTNTTTGDAPACSWFTPDFFEVTTPGVAPDEIWISIVVFDGQVGYTGLTEIFVNEQIKIDGRAAFRVEFNPNPTADPDYRAYQYVIPLGENGPTLAAGTQTNGADDYLLAKAVLERIMASFEFTR